MKWKSGPGLHSRAACRTGAGVLPNYPNSQFAAQAVQRLQEVQWRKGALKLALYLQAADRAAQRA